MKNKLTLFSSATNVGAVSGERISESNGTHSHMNNLSLRPQANE